MLSRASSARTVFSSESSSVFGSGSASRVPIAPMSEKLKTRLSYVYSAILVMSGTASSKSSSSRGDSGSSYKMIRILVIVIV